VKCELKTRENFNSNALTINFFTANTEFNLRQFENKQIRQLFAARKFHCLQYGSEFLEHIMPSQPQGLQGHHKKGDGVFTMKVSIDMIQCSDPTARLRPPCTRQKSTSRPKKVLNFTMK
jgi:hypothetical protein